MGGARKAQPRGRRCGAEGRAAATREPSTRGVRRWVLNQMGTSGSRGRVRAVGQHAAPRRPLGRRAPGSRQQH